MADSHLFALLALAERCDAGEVRAREIHAYTAALEQLKEHEAIALARGLGAPERLRDRAEAIRAIRRRLLERLGAATS